MLNLESYLSRALTELFAEDWISLAFMCSLMHTLAIGGGRTTKGGEEQTKNA